MRAGLLSPFQSPDGRESWWGPHRLVAELAGQRWSGNAAGTHRQLGSWFAERGQSLGDRGFDALAVEHFLQAGEANAAWPPAWRVVLGYRHGGRYREALVWVDRVLQAEPSGPARGIALTVQVQLARMAGMPPADAEARLKEAEKLVGGEDHPFVLSELGSLYSRRGELARAADALERAVAAQTKLTGEESQDLAIWLHELAGVLQAQGDLAGARQRLERSLEIQAAVFGTELHPDVAASLHALAGVLQAQGDPAGARQRLERVLEIERQVYGTTEHYSTAITEMNLAMLLVELGEVPQAVELLIHAHGVFQRQLGPEHPYTQQLAEMLGTPPNA